jgi:DNA-binding NarL/FixJ family response regulator
MRTDAEPLPHSVIAPRPVRVAVAAAHELYRRGLRTSLEAAGIVVAGEGGTVAASLADAGPRSPDVVVLDLDGLDAGAAGETVAAAGPTARVVVLAAERAQALSALLAGAVASVRRTAQPEEVCDAVAAAARGDAFITEPGASMLLQVARANQIEPSAAHRIRTTLSTREAEVLRAVAAGCNNTAIASALYISSKTVKNHIASILEKLGLDNRVQAAVYAVRAGLTPVPLEAAPDRRPRRLRDPIGGPDGAD